MGDWLIWRANLAALLLASVIAFRSIETGFSQAGLRLALTLNDVSITDLSELFVGDLPAPESAVPLEREVCEVSPPIALETVLRFAEKLLLSRGFALLDCLEQPSLLMRPQAITVGSVDATFNSYIRQTSAERIGAASDELCAYLQRM